MFTCSIKNKSNDKAHYAPNESRRFEILSTLSTHDVDCNVLLAISSFACRCTFCCLSAIVVKCILNDCDVFDEVVPTFSFT